ncbi:PocR ligand-binding domain-containing protein [Tessaracoccus massiliensis]|uniref:PocR ligand-binding domain-containing protein n=1 Tax=Tessaracoccus massiliensis TaxID=1522311 RepID=UPI0006949A26|nr:PocR ligand-binding domain-containing protein [Tessaracoccus massiliensis]
MPNVTLGDVAPYGLHLRNLVDVTKLQGIQDEFAADTGLAMITVDSMGSPVTQASEFSPLCKLLRRDPQVRRLCFSCDAHGGFQSAIEGKPFVYRCHAGLVDFSVSIMMSQHFLGAILAGQVFLDRGQESLGRLMQAGGLSAEVGEEADELLSSIKVVQLSKLESAAEKIVKLANDALGQSNTTYNIGTGLYLGRVRAPHDDESPLAGTRTHLPLVLVNACPTPRLDAQALAANLQAADVGANLDLLTRYLDGLLPRWSQKIHPSELAEYEDVLIGLATGEGVQVGRDISQSVIRNRNRRRAPLNRYESQVYCEKLLIQLHNLVEPTLLPGERTVASLLNEIERNPTTFVTLGKAAEYLMWSESHFARQFKEHTGQSFINYVTAKRLERAKFLLTHTTKPVLRIATELGFQPPNYFSRTFKKHEGLTPSEFREQLSRSTP